MALSYYMDVHVPAAITQGLRRRGIDVLTSQADGTREDEDQSLLERAAALGRLLFSQDEDFLSLAAEWQRLGRPFTGLIFAEQAGLSIGRCVDDLQLIAECCTAHELANQVRFIPL